MSQDMVKKPSVANVLNEIIQNAMAKKPESSEPKSGFMAMREGKSGSSGQPVSGPADNLRIENAGEKLNELRQKNHATVDDFVNRMALEAKMEAGPEPGGKDLVASISHEKEVMSRLSIKLANPAALRKLEEEINRA